MTSKGAGFFAILGMCVFAVPVVMLPIVALGVYNAFCFGYVLSQLWLWFAVPIGAAPLSWKLFAGAVIAKNMFRSASQPSEDEDVDKKKTAKYVATILGAMLMPWAALGLAWLIK